MKSLAHILNISLLVALFWYSFAVWDDLPARIPVHYDIAGRPDGWAEKDWTTWILLPAISLAVTALMYVITLIVRVARRSPNPWWINVPRKDLFLRLSPEARSPIFASLAAMLYWFAVPMNANFLAIQWMSARVARGTESSLPVYFLPVTLGAVFAMAIAWIVAVRRQIVRAALDAGIEDR